MPPRSRLLLNVTGRVSYRAVRVGEAGNPGPGLRTLDPGVVQPNLGVILQFWYLKDSRLMAGQIILIEECIGEVDGRLNQVQAGLTRIDRLADHWVEYLRNCERISGMTAVSSRRYHEWVQIFEKRTKVRSEQRSLTSKKAALTLSCKRVWDDVKHIIADHSLLVFGGITTAMGSETQV